MTVRQLAELCRSSLEAALATLMTALSCSLPPLALHYPSVSEGVFCLARTEKCPARQQQLKAAHVSLSENVSATLCPKFCSFSLPPSHWRVEQKKPEHVSKIEILFSKRPTTTTTTGAATLATCNCNHAMYSFCIRRLCVRLDWNKCVANTRHSSAKDIDN